MKYQINASYANDFSVYEKNKLPARSYFIPYKSKKAFDGISSIEERYKSSMVNLLSGEWKFKYYDKISSVPNEFDSDNESMDIITVPCTWQRTGFEPPYYINSRYQFPATPPNVPEDMPAGVYVKKFNISENAENPIITFLGVCSSLTLYINGEFVGYSEGSHNSAEFLIKDFVSAGENELLAFVSKWCSGTYLECQDMFRENGIFRDVYITENPKEYIYDIKLEIQKEEEGYSLVVSAKTEAESMHGKKIKAALVKDGKTVARAENYLSSETFIDFGFIDVKEWNAEKPELYELYISLFKGEEEIECIREKAGFRNIEIKGERFLFNGRPIKIKGVNHHDTNEKTGYVMTPSDILKDIRLMKKFNVNAVRTSHYPPDPLFIRLCDEYGLYVIDEADIESHGIQQTLDGRSTGTPNLISNDKKWLPYFFDRVLRLYERDKNCACVIMWSLGNESGGWKNQDKCYEMLKELSSVPVHYEGVIHTPRAAYDVISEMYQRSSVVEKIGGHMYFPHYTGKPYFLCEYCHAMGVGPGALEEYWKSFYAHNNLMGGCIWEWADHSVYDENAEYAYTYGGDHGEKYHDSNFCVDGLFYPDRTPHTGAYEMKNVYRPIRAEKIGENIYLFKNTNSFTNANEYQIDYELFKNGIPADEGSARFNIEPLSSKEVILEHKTLSNDADVCINFSYKDKDGEEVAFEQIILSEKPEKYEPSVGGKLSVSESDGYLTVKFDNGEAVFSNRTGALTSYKICGNQLLYGEKGFVPNVFRAPIDNDMHIAEEWRAQGLDKLEFVKDSFEYEENSKNCFTEIKTEGYLNYGDESLFEFEIEYKVYGSGVIEIEAELEKTNVLKKYDLPRFGLNILLDPLFNQVKYYGIGEKENLADFKAQSVLGIYESDVSGMCENYIKPQDNGNRGGTRWIELKDSDGKGIKIISGDSPFSFSVHPYTEDTLIKAAHREDLRDEGLVSLNIDGFMRGTGTNSCGQDVLPEYKIDFKKELEFRFFIIPIV